jgi:hypothetical protein
MEKAPVVSSYKPVISFSCRRVKSQFLVKSLLVFGLHVTDSGESFPI